MGSLAVSCYVFEELDSLVATSDARQTADTPQFLRAVNPHVTTIMHEYRAVLRCRGQGAAPPLKHTDFCKRVGYTANDNIQQSYEGLGTGSASTVQW